MIPITNRSECTFCVRALEHFFSVVRRVAACVVAGSALILARVPRGEAPKGVFQKIPDGLTRQG